MKNRKLIFIALSFFLSIFLTYILFPFGLIKDVLINRIQSELYVVNTDVKIKVKSLSSYWITGLKFKKIEISNQNSSVRPLLIDSISVRISILPLFIGRLSISSHMQIGEGESNISVSLSIPKILSNNLILNELNAEFEQLKIDEILSEIIYLIKTNNNPNLALIVPVIQDSSVGGLLNGSIDYKNAPHFPSSLHLYINNGYLDINNSALGIPKQIFSTANISMVYEDLLLSIKKDTNFKAQNISILTNGTIKQGENRSKSAIMNLSLQIKLSGKIESNFGFLLPQLLKCPNNNISGGVMNIQLVGALDNFKCQ